LAKNFNLQLVFLLLCLPQLQDWQIRKYEVTRRSGLSNGLLVRLEVLWLNGMQTVIRPSFAPAVAQLDLVLLLDRVLLSTSANLGWGEFAHRYLSREGQARKFLRTREPASSSH